MVTMDLVNAITTDRRRQVERDRLARLARLAECCRPGRLLSLLRRRPR